MAFNSDNICISLGYVAQRDIIASATSVGSVSLKSLEVNFFFMEVCLQCLEVKREAVHSVFYTEFHLA